MAGSALAACGQGARPAGGQPAGARQDDGLPAGLLAGARPIGRGPRFVLAVRGPVLGPCRRGLGARFGVHVELFAANRVLLLPAAIGVRPPLRRDAGRIAAAGCYGALVTLEPTGVVLMRPGQAWTLGDLFRSWGQPLSERRLASFAATTGAGVRVYVGGRRRPEPPGRVRLTRHAEIVLELGPYVPPHPAYTFPPGS